MGSPFLAPFFCLLWHWGKWKDMEELAKPENLQKLVDIAHRLNFDGWFLNIESYKDYNDSHLNSLKLAIQKMDLRGKEIIWYLPRCDQSDHFDPKSKGVRMTCDDKINNTAYAFLEEEKKLYLNFYHLVQIVFLNQAPQLPHVCWWTLLEKHTKTRGYLVDPVRFPYAQNCLWQFFLGENGLERKPTDCIPGMELLNMQNKENDQATINATCAQVEIEAIQEILTSSHWQSPLEVKPIIKLHLLCLSHYERPYINLLSRPLDVFILIVLGFISTHCFMLVIYHFTIVKLS